MKKALALAALAAVVLTRSRYRRRLRAQGTQ